MTTYPDLQLYIGGSPKSLAHDRGDLPVVNPSTEDEIGRLPVAEEEIGPGPTSTTPWPPPPPGSRSGAVPKPAGPGRPDPRGRRG